MTWWMTHVQVHACRLVYYKPIPVVNEYIWRWRLVWTSLLYTYSRTILVANAFQWKRVPITTQWQWHHGLRNTTWVLSCCARCATKLTGVVLCWATGNCPPLQIQPFPQMWHCLYPLLPPKRGRNNRHRPKGHDYEFPNCTYNFHKQSYITNCLFRFLYWFYIACIHTVLCVYVCYMLLINTLTLTLI